MSLILPRITQVCGTKRHINSIRQYKKCRFIIAYRSAVIFSSSSCASSDALLVELSSNGSDGREKLVVVLKQDIYVNKQLQLFGLMVDDKLSHQ